MPAQRAVPRLVEIIVGREEAEGGVSRVPEEEALVP
jgi:hypothetical protein